MTPYIIEAKYGKGCDPFGAIREPSELIQSYMDISKDIGLI